MNRRAFIAAAAAAGVTAGAAIAAMRFRDSISAARARIAVGSQIALTTFGPIEWAEAGAGSPLLMLHGTGGGYDQGLAFTRRLWERSAPGGYRVIAPSRFGYLRTAFPDDASSEAEADAMAALLDQLGIDRLPVMGGSAGALPAIQFAIRHPDRCSALVALVPATFVPGRPALQPAGALAWAIIRYGLQSDALFWAGMTLAEDRMIATLLATDPALVHAAPAEEQARVRAILHSILPVSARTQGILNDGHLAGNPRETDLGRIRAPTFALSCEDDRFGTAAAARHIAASVGGAALMVLPQGGHVYVGHEAKIFAAIDTFLSRLA